MNNNSSSIYDIMDNLESRLNERLNFTKTTDYNHRESLGKLNESEGKFDYCISNSKMNHTESEIKKLIHKEMETVLSSAKMELKSILEGYMRDVGDLRYIKSEVNILKDNMSENKKLILIFQDEVEKKIKHKNADDRDWITLTELDSLKKEMTDKISKLEANKRDCLDYHQEMNGNLAKLNKDSNIGSNISRIEEDLNNFKRRNEDALTTLKEEINNVKENFVGNKIKEDKESKKDNYNETGRNISELNRRIEDLEKDQNIMKEIVQTMSLNNESFKNNLNTQISDLDKWENNLLQRISDNYTSIKSEVEELFATIKKDVDEKLLKFKQSATVNTDHDKRIELLKENINSIEAQIYSQKNKFTEFSEFTEVIKKKIEQIEVEVKHKQPFVSIISGNGNNVAADINNEDNERKDKEENKLILDKSQHNELEPGPEDIKEIEFIEEVKETENPTQIENKINNPSDKIQTKKEDQNAIDSIEEIFVNDLDDFDKESEGDIIEDIIYRGENKPSPLGKDKKSLKDVIKGANEDDLDILDF